MDPDWLIVLFIVVAGVYGLYMIISYSEPIVKDKQKIQEKLLPMCQEEAVKLGRECRSVSVVVR